MDQTADFSFVVAEIAIALAGFSAVVMGLKLRTAEFKDTDRWGLIYILLAGGSALFFSLLPHALSYSGLSPIIAQNITTASLATLFLTTTAWAANATRRTQPRYPFVFWILLVAMVLVGIALVVQLLFLESINLTPFALLMLLVVAFSQFFTFLLDLWSGTSDLTNK